MPSRLKNNFFSIKSIVFFVSVIGIKTNAESIKVPQCPQIITVKDNKVIDAKEWHYDPNRNFLDNKTGSMVMRNGILLSEYKYPEISKINTSKKRVSGGLSYDTIEERDDFLSMTWDIQKIHEASEAVFVCNFYGDQKTERPVRLIYVYQRVPRDIKECTVSYSLVNYERIPESQKLICTK